MWGVVGEKEGGFVAYATDEADAKKVCKSLNDSVPQKEEDIANYGWRYNVMELEKENLIDLLGSLYNALKHWGLKK